MNGTNTAEIRTFDAAELGAMMREMRENLGHELADVATDLRIRLVYLEAIEAGRLADLPGSAYASGFLRTYSDYLGLDGDEIVRRFRMAGVDMSSQTQLHLPSPVEEGRLPTGPILLLAAIVAGVAYGGWYFFSSAGTGSMSSVAELPAELARLIENHAEEVVGETPAPAAVAPSGPAPAMIVDRPTLPDSAVAAPAPALLLRPTGPAPATAADSGEAPTAAATPASPSEAGGSVDTASERAADQSAATGPAVPGASGPASSSRQAETAPPQEAALSARPDARREPAPARDSTEATAAPAAVAPPVPAPVEPELQAAAATSTAPEPAPAAVEPPAGATAGAPPVSRSAPESTATTATASEPEPQPAAPPQIAPAADSRRIVVRATADSFVAVLTRDNQPLFSQLMRPGDSYEVPSGADLVLETGNAGGLEISVGGRPAPSLGPIGSIRRNIPLDAEKLLQGSY